jgi:hypothetical protein
VMRVPSVATTRRAPSRIAIRLRPIVLPAREREREDPDGAVCNEDRGACLIGATGAVTTGVATTGVATTGIAAPLPCTVGRKKAS